MFTSTQNKGFRMDFENKFSISVQWGLGNYCSNRSSFENGIKENQKDFINSISAEVAIFFDNVMLPVTHNEVIGWVSTNDVARIIAMVSSANNKKELVKQIEQKIW